MPRKEETSAAVLGSKAWGWKGMVDDDDDVDGS